VVFEMIRIPDGSKGWHPHLPLKNIIIICILGGIIASAIFASSRSLLAKQLQFLSASAASKTIASNGTAQWANDATVTTPVSTFALSTSKQIPISPLFQRYYQSHGAAGNLGVPITSAFPIKQGWLQFFASGALFLPAKQLTDSQNSSDTLTSLLNYGSKDAARGIIRLPLLQALLTAGSQVPIANIDSPFNYVNLRKATDPTRMQPAPTQLYNSSSPANNLQAHFVTGGTRAGKDVGHFIPQTFWSYINRTDVSPDGWMQDFGAPLTEALPFTLTVNGKTHHIVVQAFAQDGVLLDQDAKDTSGHPFIQRLATGVDYLSTFGLPTIAAQVQRPIWTLGNTVLLAHPASGQPIAHAGQNFALKLLGNTQWIGGMLWYHAQWSTPKTTPSGWISASDITFTSPGNVPQWASMDMLSPQLATYLSKIGPTAGVVVYDVTHQRYYTYNSTTPFIVASSMKVPIMLTFFDSLEQQGLEPDDDQMNVLTTMIENSDNDSASDLFFNELNGATSITNYMRKIKVSGLNPDQDAWGYSTISPQAMVNLLTLFYEGKILTRQDRATAYNLMENIESDQQVGVGNTAPNGSTVALKDGWVPGPDGLWAMNSSGIVMSGKETYIISVYTQEQQSLDTGQAIVTHVCSSVASLLD
jgi:beta-lactamase class A